MNKPQGLVAALGAERSETRLRAALAAGTDPEPELLDELVARCGVEPDFYVRDMLTWAITRYPVERTVPAVTAELESSCAQARSQALHTLSKIGDGSTWSAITRELLTDEDDEVSRSAWRAAVVLVPGNERAALAAILASQFGRGDADMHRSLSRALVELGDAADHAVALAQRSPDPVIRGHAAATEQLAADPESAFVFDIDLARRAAALGE
ncbi:HEAT repeat domain-containing protein [Gordonia sp. HY285]|uniref:HEAT repeat domain-containing protein n=1 Tax=Gordonia liuliyuniae TaxID=2911517 RepID=UPI001F223BE1|nr:HEAT repeat domain-containing protein [Gordonia liuliyuniae]MCF8608733.1 HEAT repeat domain-containing protein [Gordonia liuliyuniae]